jgi:ABC-type Fe3+ transport system permease subunit
MYIPEFWVGVMSTLFVEIIGLILAIAVSYTKDKNKKR